MKIAVLIKQVPETDDVKMDEATGTLVRKGNEAVVNPLDLFAIECALQLAGKYGAETTAISMGPPAAAAAIREAISMGIDSGILISDRAFAGSDTWATANILAAALRHCGPFDLVLCGERATDGDTGQVGPETASALDMPVAAYVSKVREINGSSIIVEQRNEHGIAVTGVQLPAVLTVLKETGTPRLPTLRGKIKARDSVIKTLGQQELELPQETIGLAGSPTRVVKIFHPQVVRKCRLFTASGSENTESAVRDLVAAIKDSGADK